MTKRREKNEFFSNERATVRIETIFFLGFNGSLRVKWKKKDEDLEGLSDAGYLHERFEDGPFQKLLFVDLLLQEDVRCAFALTGRQRQ